MRFTLFVAALAGTVAPLCAQGQPPAVLQIGREAIKEGKGAAHRKVEQEYTNAFRRNKYPYYYLALSAESGPGEVWFFSAFPSFAAIEDSDKLTQKAPLKGELELLDARDGEVRASSRNITAVYQKDMSYLPANAPPVGKWRYVFVETFRLRLGHDEDFMAGGKMFSDAYKKANIPSAYVMYQVIAGAPEGTYLLINPMTSLKELDEQPAREKALMEAMGQDNFRRLMKSTGDVFQNMESTLFVVSPQMSYVSKETEDQDPAFWRPKATTTAAPAKSKEKVEKTGQ